MGSPGVGEPFIFVSATFNRALPLLPDSGVRSVFRNTTGNWRP